MNTTIRFGLIATFLLTGCGGGGSAGTSVPGTPGVTVLPTAVVAGAPAFVTNSQHVAYTFANDTTPNQSNCNGQCAAVWPPIVPPVVALGSPWGTLTRQDGTAQLSYNGKPLYTFTGDTAPDVANGNGLNGFHVARPLAGPGNGVPPGSPGYNP